MLNVIKQIIKTFENTNLNVKNQYTQKQHTHVKNFKKQLMTIYFL